jgi:o-succinylbenzoate---CoA ligase
LSGVKNTIIGGAKLSSSLEEQCRQLSNAVYHTYGMTETCSHFAMRLLNTSRSEQHFRPLDGYHVSLDERGCLCVEGPVTNMKKLCTNDMAELYKDGSFDILGRIDNVVNSGALKLSPEILESRLAEKISGTAFFFAGLPDEKLGERLVLLLEGNEDIKPAVVEALNDFSTYEKPKQIFFLESFAYTETGKLNRKASLEKLKQK